MENEAVNTDLTPQWEEELITPVEKNQCKFRVDDNICVIVNKVLVYVNFDFGLRSFSLMDQAT